MLVKQMSPELASEVYDVLVEHAGADPSDDARIAFVHVQSSPDREPCTEYRFCGGLGFGGKFWRNPSPGSQGWYVSTYPELMQTKTRRDIVKATNAALKAIEEREGGAF